MLPAQDTGHGHPDRRLALLAYRPLSLAVGPRHTESARVYRVGIVLTLATGKSEGHLAYRSQSDNPLQGTTLGGSADDPRREGTRTAPACHPARPGAGQCQSGVPGSGDLPRAVLPLAPPAGALRDRRRASTSISGPPRPARRTGPGDGAAGAERRGECGDVGREPHRRLCRATLGPAHGSQYRAAGAATRGLGDAAPAADGARAPRGA